MAKSDARFKYLAQLGRQDHDLSQRFGFTTTSGMLLPLWFDYASPGDTYYMKHDLPLLRSDVLLAPAMIDVKVHFETFFVPMQMIYEPFENSMFSIKPIRSSNFSPSSLQNEKLPLLSYSGQIGITLSTPYYATDYHADAYRLADLLGLLPENFLPAASSPLQPYAPNFFPYQLAAYHTIFEYYFRLDDKTDFQNQMCNLDSEYAQTTFTKPVDFFSIHQRPWDFDYYSSMYRSPIVSDANLQDVVPNSVYSDLVYGYGGSGTRTTPIDINGTTTTTNSDKRAISSNFNSNYDSRDQRSGVSTALIRQMFANEKLAMITGRTRKNYDSQVLAHYGIKVPHDVKHDITMIHQDTYELNVQEVTSLAATNDAPLGELAGKGYSSGRGEKFKFIAPCDGVVMTIFSVEPKKRYCTGFDRINAVADTFDFPRPEFDRLGNMPMFGYEVGLVTGQTATHSQTSTVGWKERYYANKRKMDKTTRAFMGLVSRGSSTFNAWSSYFISMYPFCQNFNGGPGPNNSIAIRPDVENRFYIERNAMDNVSSAYFAFGWLHPEEGQEGEDWDVTPWLLYQRDPFIVNSRIECKKVSWMSKDGEPVYNY